MLFPRLIFVIFSFCVCIYPCMFQCFPFPLLRSYLHICIFYDNHQITLLNSCSLDTSCEGTDMFFGYIMQTLMRGDDMIISSLNVRGLSNDKKQRETFLWLKKKQFSIYFLQEVHSTKKSGIYCRSESGYSTIFTKFSSSKAGVGILFNNNFQFKIQKWLTRTQEEDSLSLI